VPVDITRNYARLSMAGTFPIDHSKQLPDTISAEGMTMPRVNSADRRQLELQRAPTGLYEIHDQCCSLRGAAIGGPKKSRTTALGQEKS
jgi:hypothetical protein